MATEMVDYGLYLNVGTLLALFGTVASVAWKISHIEQNIRYVGSKDDKDLREHVEAEIENVAQDVLRLERDSIGRYEMVRREIGEMNNAIREKIHETEVFARDQFATKKSVEGAIDRLNQSIEKLGDRLESKIDRATFGHGT